MAKSIKKNKNVIYYKVEEIVKMTFGGTTTRYTVSNLSLISKVNLGPDNIRIITPIYKDKKYKTKSYYVETRNLKKDSGKSQAPTDLIEIKIENSNIIIPENSKIEKISLAFAIDNLTTSENPQKPTIPIVIKNENQKVKKVPLVLANNNSKNEESAPASTVKTESEKEKPYISINVTDVYERVAQKGYKSVYMFKEIANNYFFKNQMEKAVKWYEELFAMNSDLEPIYYYRFGDALKKTGNIKKGNTMIEKFNKLVE